MIERMKQVAAQMMAQFGTQRMGTVYDYDLASYSVRVQIQPTGEITGWIPIGAEWVGNGFGMAIGPNIGDQVRIDPLEGSKQIAVMGKRFFNDVDTPLAVPSGECWLVHSSRSLIKLLNNGDIEIHSSRNITATADGDITATAINNATVTATNITATALAVATIIAPSIILKNAGAAIKKLCTEVFMQLYNSHTHPYSGGQTQTPTQQAAVGTHTTNIVQAE